MRSKSTTPPDVTGIAADRAGPDMRAARIAAGQHGVVSTRQLHACGLSSSAITLRTRRGTLHRVHRGVYAVLAPVALSPRGRATAAVLACGPGAVLSHWAAASWWGMAEDDGRAPDVTVPGNGGRKLAGIRVHRSRALAACDVWERDRIRVTSPARTALDLAAELSPRALRRMLRQAEADGRLNVRQLRGVLRRANGHAGVGALRVIVADGRMPTRSPAEDLMLDLLAGAGLPIPEVNVSLTLERTTVVPDLLWRAQRVVVEVDGARFHAGELARRDDAHRQARLEAHGYRVLRIAYAQLVDRPQETLARVAHALAASRA